MEEETYLIFALLAFLIVGFIRSYQNRKKAKERISDHLRERGATDIEVANRSLPFGTRGDLLFDVQYTDKHDNFHKTSCKLWVGLLSASSDIYWSDSPES